MEIIKSKFKSRTKLLEAALGGKWRHVPFQEIWFCDDGRLIRCVLCDCNDENCVFYNYYLYTPGKPAVLFSFYEAEQKLLNT